MGKKKRKKVLPVFEMDELMEIFEYPNRRALNRALRTGRLPIDVFWLSGRRVCHVEVVNRFFEMKKEEGFALLEESS